MASLKTITTKKLYLKPYAIILCFLIILGVGFLPLFSVIQEGAYLVFSILPLIAAWLLGFRLGILYWALHCFLLNFISIAAGQTIDDFLSKGIFTYILTLLFTGAVGKISDLTRRLRNELKERKRFEEELQHYKKDLEKLVKDRTEELLKSNEMLKQEMMEREKASIKNQKLEASLKRAEKMEAIGILAGSVAHDLNNILSGILSYPELILLDIPEDSPLREPILTIKESGEKAAAVVQDLLAMTRRGIIGTQVLNMNNVVSDVLGSPEFVKLTTDYPGIEIGTELEPDLFNLRGSKVHLSKAIMNLMTNAVEAMKKDGGQLIISTSNVYIDTPSGDYDFLAEGEYVAVRVSDSGEGISKEDLNRVFEPFYTKKVMGRSGTGLGLAIVWGTVKDHNGYVDVRSQIGDGTIFTLYFPSTREAVFTGEPGLNLDDYSGSGESILVIDDVELQRKFCTSMLEKLNYSVTSVSGGEEAVEYLADHSFDLLILDMIMDGGMDGLETYKRIIDMHPSQKAVIASGFSESDRVREAQGLGAGTYLRKPYTMEELGMAVKNELQGP
ncbi:MAG: response regulator [Deltaproteobacteria bacterium]|nr:response regulator [Deltaproteobacteria bacterium]